MCIDPAAGSSRSDSQTDGLTHVPAHAVRSRCAPGTLTRRPRRGKQSPFLAATVLLTPAVFRELLAYISNLSLCCSYRPGGPECLAHTISWQYSHARGGNSQSGGLGCKVHAAYRLRPGTRANALARSGKRQALRPARPISEKLAKKNEK